MLMEQRLSTFFCNCWLAPISQIGTQTLDAGAVTTMLGSFGTQHDSEEMSTVDVLLKKIIRPGFEPENSQKWCDMLQGILQYCLSECKHDHSNRFITCIAFKQACELSSLTFQSAIAQYYRYKSRTGPLSCSIEHLLLVCE